MRMRIKYLSDLHLDFQPDIIKPNLINDDYDILVFLGDLSNNCLKHMSFLKKIKERDNKDILFVLGNHDYYGSSINKIEEEIEKNHRYIKLMNNKTYIREGFKFIGTTLWSEAHPLDSNIFNFDVLVSKFPDYSYIYEENLTDLIIPNKTRQLFNKNLNFIMNEINDDHHNVVLTHHAPSRKSSIHPIDNQFNPLFFSNLDRLIEESNVDLWLCGHLHTRKTYKIGKTLVSSNELGYDFSDFKSFDFNKTIDLEALVNNKINKNLNI